MSDAPGIARVDVNSWRSTYVGIVPDDFLASYSLSDREGARRKSLADESTSTYVAEHPLDGIVGFLSGGPARMEDMPFAGELYAVYLLEEYQRKGIGRKLVGELCAWLPTQGLTFMYTWALEDNPYRRFYESLGGIEFRRQTMTLHGHDLVEVAYGWDDITPLAFHRKETPANLS